MTFDVNNHTTIQWYASRAHFYLKYLPSSCDVLILNAITTECVFVYPFGDISGILVPGSGQRKVVHRIVLIDAFGRDANANHWRTMVFLRFYNFLNTHPWNERQLKLNMKIEWIFCMFSSVFFRFFFSTNFIRRILFQWKNGKFSENFP